MAENYFEQFVAPGLQRDAQREQLGMQQRQLGMDEAKFAYGLQQQQQQQARQQAFTEQFGKAWASGDKEALVNIGAQFPDQIETIQKAVGFRDDTQKQTIGKLGLELNAAIKSGRTDAAARIIAENAETLRGYGPGYEPETLLQELQEDPSALADASDKMSLIALGPKQYYDVMNQRDQQATARRGQDITARGQDIQIRGQNIAASNAAQRLAFDQGKFAVEMQQALEKADELKAEAPKLSVNMEKALDSAVGGAATSRSSAASMEELASRWETDKPTSGIFGSAQSTWNKMTGSDTGLRDLRIRTSQFLNSQALKYLPPGPATDRDVELAREGVPTNMDDPKLVANWLRAQARNEKRDAAFNDFRAEWISAQGNPGQAKTAANISGLDVKKGESFAAAAKRYMKQAESQVAGGEVGQGIGSGSAPQAAIDYLRSNPQMKGAFKAKYGYLPEGM